jgi:hypothetical protein
MVIIEGIMTLYIKEVLIPEKVAEVVNRFSVLEIPDEIPEDPEEAALFWINKSCVKLKQIMQKEMNEDETTRNEPLPPLPMLEDLTDMSDGCCLAAILSFYCPDHLRWQEICLNKEMSMADSIYNLQLVQFFCQEKLPYNICFLSLEDFLYLHETIRPNVLAFIADLLFLFEIRTAKCVRQPGLDYDTEIPTDNEIMHNGSSLSYPDLPTPAEMKAKSLQHSSWVDERQQLEQRNGSTPIRSPRKSSSSAKLRQRSSSSHNLSDEDEELTRYFSALDIKADLEPSPEILMIAERNFHKTPIKTGPKSITTYSNNIKDNNKDNNLDQNDYYLSSSPVRHSDTSNGNNNKSSQLADYFSQLSQTNSSSSRKTAPNTTSFAKLNSENSKNLSLTTSPEPSINIAYSHKNEKTPNVEQKSPVKSQSSRSIPHINKSDSVKQLLERENETNDISKSSANLSTDKQNTSDSEIASQVYNIRMKLEEKRRKIEQERKNAEEEWKSNRQNIGKEAFLRVVHKNGKEDNESDVRDVSVSKNKQTSNQEKREILSINDVVQDLDTLKRKWFEDKRPNDQNKPFVLNQSGDKVNFDDLKASIDLMESSITDIDADLEILQEHELMLRSHRNVIPVNNSDKSKFFLSPDHQKVPQPLLNTSQPFHLAAEPQIPPQQTFNSLSFQQQNTQQIHPSMISQQTSTLAQRQQQQRAMWSDNQVYNPNDGTQPMGPRRGQWGQPVMPVSTNTGSGINQWKTVPIPQQQIDPNFQQSNYEPFDIHGLRQTTNMPFNSQAFHPMVAQNSYNYNLGGHYNTLNSQHSSYAHQNGPIPQTQFNFQGFPQPQYAPNNSIGQYAQTQQFNPNLSNSSINYNQTPPHQMLTNPEQNYHSMSINHFNNQPINQENSQQMRPMLGQTPTLINSQPINMPSVPMPSHYEEYDNQQVFSSPTNKTLIGRTFRVSKPKVLSPDISEQNSPTRSIINEFSNEALNNGKNENSPNSSIPKDNSNVSETSHSNESFFISFGNEPKSKAKPGLKPKQVKLQQQMRRELKSANASSNLSALNIPSNESLDQNTSSYMSETPPKQNTSQLSNSVSPGVGFVIGADLVNPEPSYEDEMARRKESIMIQSLKRRAEQEAKRLKKEQELAHKREEERLRREHSEKKKEEERIKRQFILEQYRQRKAAEEAEKNGSIGNSSTFSSRDSNRNNSTLVLNRPSRQRLFSAPKPRPKSLHVSASNIQDYSSLDCKPSRIMDDTDSCQNLLSSNSANSRPQSAMSAQSQNSAFSLSTARRLPSPTQSHPSNVPSFSSGFMLSRFRGPPSDGASDAGSTFSEYTGPKLFVKPSQKSNKVLILNAINVVLAGAVNSDTKKKVLEVYFYHNYQSLIQSLISCFYVYLQTGNQCV